MKKLTCAVTVLAAASTAQADNNDFLELLANWGPCP